MAGVAPLMGRCHVALHQEQRYHRGLPQQDGDDIQESLRLQELRELQAEGQSHVCLGEKMWVAPLNGVDPLRRAAFTCVFVWRSQPKPWRRLAPHSVADWHRLTTWLQRVERMRDVLQAAWAIALAIRDACELRLSWERTGLCRIQGLPYAQFLVRPLVTRMTRAVSPMESIEWG